MIKVYAFEPEAICDPTLARSLEQFGFSQGRVIAEMPRSWRKMIHAHREKCAPGNEKLKEHLVRLAKRRAFCRVSADDAGSDTWIERAIRTKEDEVNGILVRQKGSATDPRIIDGDDLHTENEIWQAATSMLCPRTPADMAGCLKPLIRSSSELKFVDPYFCGEDKHLDFIRECIRLRYSAKPKRLMSIEIHFFARLDRRNAYVDSDKHDSEDRVFQSIVALAEKGLKSITSIASESTTLYQWQELKNGHRFHERFVITDLATVDFGGGLNAGSSSQDTTVKLMSDKDSEVLRARYSPSSSSFKLLNKQTI